MKILILVDNTDGEKAKGEHGLSVYIEYRDKRILLDTGATELFKENADALGIDLSSIDVSVLSHAHYDHSGGTEKFFKENADAKLYVRKGSEENCYHIKDNHFEYIGIPKGVFPKYDDRIIYADGKCEILPGVWIIPHSTEGLSSTGIKNRLYVCEGENHFTGDDFRHEQTLILEASGELIVLNSCSHAGPDVIVREVEEAFPGKHIKTYIGGFHLMNTCEEDVRELAKRLKETEVDQFYTGHCTGEEPYKFLREELGDRVEFIHAGMEIVVSGDGSV